MGERSRRVQRPNDPAREVVRVGRLDHTLEKFNQEMGVKVAGSMEVFHTNYIAPLVERIEELEWQAKPWYEKWWWRLKNWANFLKALALAIPNLLPWRRPEPETVNGGEEPTSPDSEPVATGD